MQSVSPAQKPRRHYRHELRSLTYVNLDEGNGGIVRNLNCDGLAVQAVGALREQQQVRLHFELRFPRVRVEARGLVSWATSSGQCGIRFIDLPKRTAQLINDWIFSNLLESAAREFTPPVAEKENGKTPVEQDEAISSFSARRTLAPVRLSAIPAESKVGMMDQVSSPPLRKTLAQLAHTARSVAQLISHPPSARTLGWVIDALVMFAAMLLFALVFLSIAHELPPWPLALTTVLTAVFFVPTAYWALFAILGGPSLGVRLTETAYLGERERHDAEQIGFR